MARLGLVVPVRRLRHAACSMQTTTGWRIAVDPRITTDCDENRFVDLVDHEESQLRAIGTEDVVGVGEEFVVRSGFEKEIFFCGQSG